MLHHDRNEDLLVVEGEIVDARIGDRLGVFDESGDADARHREISDLLLECDHHG